MRTKSNTVSGSLILLLIALLGASFIPYQKSRESLQAAQAKISADQRNLKAKQRKYEELKTTLQMVPDATPAEPQDVIALYTGFNHEIRTAAPDYGILLRSLTLVDANAVGSQGVDMSTLGKPFAQIKELKVLPVKLEGKYSDYVLFKEFMDVFKRKPTAIQSLEVTGDSFILIVDLYGK